MQPSYCKVALFALSLTACATPTGTGIDAAHNGFDGASVSDSSTGDGNPAIDGGSIQDGGPLPDGNLQFDATPAVDATPSPDAGPIVGLPYPEHDAYLIKGLSPDGWDVSDLTDDYIGSVTMTLVWATWEPTNSPPPCNASQQQYEGHCYTIDAQVDAAIAQWTANDVSVIAILYGVPAWARIGNTGCSPLEPWYEIFCTPDNAADFGRFAGMLAQRYDGLHGHGRITDFVIHNEVNANDWFDIGCGQGVPCNTSVWIQTYADNFIAAYDQIMQHQSEVKVLAPFTHHFGTQFDEPDTQRPLLSVVTFLTNLDSLVGDRRWQLAHHPYGPMSRADFSPLDWQRVTYGNLGAAVGWLRETFPTKPWVWEIQLTESGVSSGEGSSEAAQAPAVCDSLYNALGTPGVTTYVYHRMKDHPVEFPLQLGLRREDGSAKPAWSVWANANRINDVPPALSCGFEHLPNTRLTRSYKDGLLGGHWTSSRRPPDGYAEQQSWYLRREPKAGTRLLIECMVDELIIDENTYLTDDVSCGSDLNLGPVGYIHTAQIADSVPLYSCSANPSGLGTDRFVSTDPGCEGGTSDAMLGYALPAP